MQKIEAFYAGSLSVVHCPMRGEEKAAYIYYALFIRSWEYTGEDMHEAMDSRKRCWGTGAAVLVVIYIQATWEVREGCMPAKCPNLLLVPVMPAWKN